MRARASLTNLLFGTVLVLLLGACGSGMPNLSQLETDALYERAMREYEAGNWDSAILAFNRFLSTAGADARAQDVQYYRADANFQDEQFITAASHFTRFAGEFPGDPRAEEARFRACDSYYRLSPPVQLDQQFTHAAVEHCQALVAYFPNSEYADSAQTMLDELREKLARKVFIGGDYYYRRQAFDSAIVYFERVLDRFPRTTVAAESLLRLVQTYQRLGYTEDAQEMRERLLEQFPESEPAQQAREIRIADGS